MDQRISRGTVLGAGAGAVAAALPGACAPSTIKRATTVAPAGSDLGAVEHVVMVMQVNRSFDHYFGSYPGVRGYDDTTNRKAFSQLWPGGSPAGRLLPAHLDTARAGVLHPADRRAERAGDGVPDPVPADDAWSGELLGALQEARRTGAELTVEGLDDFTVEGQGRRAHGGRPRTGRPVGSRCRRRDASASCRRRP